MLADSRGPSGGAGHGARLHLLAPMAIEAAALRRGATDATCLRVGIGPSAAGTLARQRPDGRGSGAPTVIAGLGGALHPGLELGEVVVAGEVRGPEGIVRLPGAPSMAAALCRAGVRARVGVVLSSPRLVVGSRRRAALAAGGADVVDMESAWLLGALQGGPHAVVRAVSDAPGQGLGATALGVARALGALRRSVPVLEAWAGACGARRVLMASPRSFCAGVERAIRVVEAALRKQGGTVYVRRPIVHNEHVVAALEAQGARFVQEIDEVPEGATVIFSAHGVSPSVRALAAARELKVIDATCPLVAKVHSEVRRFARQGYELVLVGHGGHDEVEGTLGEAPGMHLVASPAEAAALDVPRDARVAYVTQTTLATDETSEVVDTLRSRFPGLGGPAADDICFATQNRQEALRSVLDDCDLALVVGSATSSNGNRLVEVAQRAGREAYLVPAASELRPEWLTGAEVVAVTAAASTPESVVEEVVGVLASMGPIALEERATTTETVRFSLPPEVR